MTELIIGLAGVLATQFVTFYKLRVDNKAVIKKIDDSQNERIDKLESTLQPVLDYIEEQKVKDEILHKVTQISDDILAVNNLTLKNAEFKSLLIAGRDKIIQMFQNYVVLGILRHNSGLTIDKIQNNTYSSLKALKNGIDVDKMNVIPEYLDSLKNDIIIKEMDYFNRQMIKFVEGAYNGSTKKKLIDLAVEVTRDVMIKSIAHYTEYCQQRKK